jgi:putative transposase
MPPVERHNQPVILFVTVGTRPRVPVFANRPFHEAFALACADAEAWSVGKYMIMPDHVHLFCSPATDPRVGIKRWSGYLKERITKRLNLMAMEGEPVASRVSATGSGSAQPRPPSRRAWHWQPDCWDTQIRNGEHYHEKWEYVRQNPVRKGLVDKPERWHWQGELNVVKW